MTSGEAEALDIGDRVIWDGDESDRGIVVETGYCSIKVEWDNGQDGALHTNDCERLGRGQP